MSDPMVLTGAGGFGFVPGGAAVTVLEGVESASDGKTAEGTLGSPGIGFLGGLQATIESHAHLPSSIDVTVRHERTLGSPTIQSVIVYDADDVQLFALNVGTVVPGAMMDETFALVKVYSGPVNSSADWTLDILYFADSETIGLSVDQVSGVFDASGDHDAGPGGQVGPNAAFFMGMCGPFSGF